jgi:hypothetical protein
MAVLAFLPSTIKADQPSGEETAAEAKPAQRTTTNWFTWPPPASADWTAAAAAGRASRRQPERLGGWLELPAKLFALAEASDEVPQTSGQAETAQQEEVNTGQDFTKPLSRFDLRYKYQQVTGELELNMWTLRLDAPFKFGDGWQLSTRFDLPILHADVPSRDNPNGDYECGVGDILTQFLVIAPPMGRGAVGFGTQVIFPTGTQDQFGTGKYQLAPTVGGLYYPPGLPKGSFLGGLLRYQFDVGGDDDRREIDQLVIQPILNLNLPDRWFVTLAPEMRMNCRQDNDWFIPFDLTVGKMITKNIVLSVEYKQAIVNDFDMFDWELEFRIGFFF